MRDVIRVSVNDANRRIRFEENDRTPVPTASVIAEDGREGVIMDLGPDGVTVLWNNHVPCLYASVEWGPVI